MDINDRLTELEETNKALIKQINDLSTNMMHLNLSNKYFSQDNELLNKKINELYNEIIKLREEINKKN